MNNMVCFNFMKNLNKTICFDIDNIICKTIKSNYKKEAYLGIIEKAKKQTGYTLSVDLRSLKIWDKDEEIVSDFEIDDFRKHSLINGLDDIGITLQDENSISDFEKMRHPHGGVLTAEN